MQPDDPGRFRTLDNEERGDRFLVHDAHGFSGQRLGSDGHRPRRHDIGNLLAQQIGTHVPLGEYDQPMAARKNITGFFVTNGNIYWNLKKN